MNLGRAYAANGLNQYSTAGPATFCYDSRGNLTSDGTNVYRYDVENRLTESRVSVSSACPVANYTGTLKLGLEYDPLGRLWKTTTPSGSTEYLYDGHDLVAEYDGAGTMLRRHVHGAGVDEPLLWYEGSSVSASNRRFLHHDRLGSVVAVSNGSGTVLGVNSYDEYGVPASGNIGRFQYTGQAWLPELGMYHYKARIYDPKLGRFLQADPIGYGDGMNMYAYVRNDPVNWIDPSGLNGETRDCSMYTGAEAYGCNRSLGESTSAFCSQYPDACAIVITGQAYDVMRDPNYLNNRPTTPLGPTPSGNGSGGGSDGEAQDPDSEHKKNARPSTKNKHEKGQATKKKSRGGEKGDERRRPPRKRPDNWKGPWPPKGGILFILDILLNPCMNPWNSDPRCLIASLDTLENDDNVKA